MTIHSFRQLVLFLRRIRGRGKVSSGRAVATGIANAHAACWARHGSPGHTDRAAIRPPWSRREGRFGSAMSAPRACVVVDGVATTTCREGGQFQDASPNPSTSCQGKPLLL